ncbi:MAG: hypothetical protein AAGG44_09160 [Planctomycetota bacterium]
MSFDADRLYSQLIDLESGDLSQEATEELKQLLLNSPQARKAYAEWMSLDAAMMLESSQSNLAFDLEESDSTSAPSAASASSATMVLQQSEASGEGAREPSATSATQSNRADNRFDWRSVLAIACTLMACAFGLRLFQLESSTVSSDPLTIRPVTPNQSIHASGDKEQTSSGIALVTRVVRTSGLSSPAVV